MVIQDDQALLGECKWRNADINMEILNQLLERGQLFHYEKQYYLLCSKTGFTKDVSVRRTCMEFEIDFICGYLQSLTENTQSLIMVIQEDTIS